MELDELDAKILEILQENSRTPYKHIAEKLHITTPTVKSRVQNLLKLGIIKKFGAVVDDKKVSGVTSVILVEAEPSKLEGVINKLSLLDEVREIYHIGGEFELFLKVFVDSFDALEDILTREIGKIDGVRKYRSYPVISSPKEEEKVRVGSKRRIILKCEFCVCEIPHEPHIKVIDGKEHYFCCEKCAEAFAAH